MPTYEYECEQCGQIFEYFQALTDSPKTTCEICGGYLRKLLSPGAGLIFKGNGFYITDYKKKDTSADEKKTSSSKSEKSATDTKPTSASKDDVSS